MLPLCSALVQTPLSPDHFNSDQPRISLLPLPASKGSEGEESTRFPSARPLGALRVKTSLRRYRVCAHTITLSQSESIHVRIMKRRVQIQGVGGIMRFCASSYPPLEGAREIKPSAHSTAKGQLSFPSPPKQFPGVVLTPTQPCSQQPSKVCLTPLSIAQPTAG